MAQLFDANMLSSAVSTISTEEIEPYLNIVRNWHRDLKEGTLLADKETSREQSYNYDFFVRILGYVEKPQNPHTMVPKATTEAKNYPDLTLGHNDVDRGIENISAVVELKGAAVDLDRPQQREQNLTPVQQGFKYKIQYRKCPFVIVSNFREFRIYNDNQFDYNSWTLDDLVDKSNDYFKFKSWYYLIHSDRLVSASGVSQTEKLLSDIRVEQQEISEKLYREYSVAREGLIRSIIRNNEKCKNSPKLAISYAQKIIDRVVFIAFAEDRNLLPANTLLKAQRQARESEFGLDLWYLLKALFRGVDVGNANLGIPNGYNGGLFKADDEIDSLVIDDDVLSAVVKLSEYDFSGDSAVTVLGRIFEQSISDIESLKNAAGEDSGAPVWAVGRRKREGIFYTPDHVVRYMVDQTLGEYLRRLEVQLQKEVNLHEELTEVNYAKREMEAYTKYQIALQNVRIVDPACGSGAFLVNTFDFLLAENERVGKILNSLFSTDSYFRDILRNNLYGVDLNEESVEITKLSLWLKTAVKDKKLTALDQNVKTGNSLTLSWPSIFPEVFKDGGFDVVLMNPPYIKEDENRAAFQPIKKNPLYQGKMDIWYLFGGLALDIVKPETGFIGLIAQNNWVTNDGARLFRNKVVREARLEKYIDFGEYMVFADAAIQTMIATMRKSSDPQSYEFEYSRFMKKNATQLEIKAFLSQHESEHTRSFISTLDRSSAVDDVISFVSSTSFSILNKMANAGQLYLDPKKEVFSGIDAQERLGKRDAQLLNRQGEDAFEVGEGIFVLTKEEVVKKNLGTRDLELLKPLFTPSEINRYLALDNPKHFVIFTTPEYRDSKSLDGYPGVKAHLDRFAPVIRSAYRPYGVHRTRNVANYHGPRIFALRKSVGRPRFAFVDFDAYFNRSFNVIRTDRIDLKFLTCLLNSSLVAFWLRFYGKMQGANFQVDMTPLSRVPLAVPSNVDRYVELHDSVSSTTGQLAKAIEQFLDVVRLRTGLSKLPKKVFDWPHLDFEQFYKSLGVVLSLDEIEDLLEYFERKKEDYLNKEEYVRSLESEIDDRVFELYGLVDEEQQIVLAEVDGISSL